MAFGCQMDAGVDPSWRDHGVGLLVSLACVSAGDIFVMRPLFTNASARWFALHASFNLAVAALTARDVWSVLSSPLCSLAQPMASASWTAVHIILAGHFYHALAFSIKPQEARHHLVFTGIGGAITLSFPWGPLMSMTAFLISGLPGAIDYALLAAVKSGRMDPLREKKSNMLLHTWLRMPGLVFVVTVAWCCLAHGVSTRLHTPVLLAAMALCMVNGLHYGAQVCPPYGPDLTFDLSQTLTCTLPYRRVHRSSAATTSGSFTPLPRRATKRE